MSRTTLSNNTVRRTVTIAAAALLAVAAAGCGGDDSTDGVTSPTDGVTSPTDPATTAASMPTTATTAAGAGADDTVPAGAGRTVETPHGPVEVPASPTRIVSVQASATSTLFDLGVTPIAIYDEGEEYVAARYLEQWQAADKIGAAGDFNLEAITAQQPDLIVGIDYPFVGEHYAAFAAIAPTVLVDSSASWQEQVAALADALGEADAVAGLQRGYGARVAQIAADHANELAATQWNFIQGGFDPGNYWIYGPDAPVVGIAVDAGVQLATASAASADSRSVSYEEAGLLEDGDVLVFYAGADGGPLNDLDQLFAMPIFDGLPAVQAGQLLPMADFLPGSYGDAMGVLDGIESMLVQLAG